MTQGSYVLAVRCNDELGIVAAVASALTAAGAFITDTSVRSDRDAGLCHMRTVFHSADGSARTLTDFREALAPLAQRFEMEIELHAAALRIRAMLAVSRDSPCLDHLLRQWHFGELPVDIVSVVSNPHDLRRLVEWFDATCHSQ